MITLIRGPDRVRVSTLSWEAAQIYAKQMGWCPSGAMGAVDHVAHGIYGPGQTVSQADAVSLVDALKKVVNGAHGDSGDLDLDGIVLLANFLRAGAFRIC
jgi:hypothetical protein